MYPWCVFKIPGYLVLKLHGGPSFNQKTSPGGRSSDYKFHKNVGRFQDTKTLN